MVQSMSCMYPRAAFAPGNQKVHTSLDRALVFRCTLMSTSIPGLPLIGSNRPSAVTSPGLVIHHRSTIDPIGMSTSHITSCSVMLLTPFPSLMFLLYSSSIRGHPGGGHTQSVVPFQELQWSWDPATFARTCLKAGTCPREDMPRPGPSKRPGPASRQGPANVARTCHWTSRARQGPANGQARPCQRMSPGPPRPGGHALRCPHSGAPDRYVWGPGRKKR